MRQKKALGFSLVELVIVIIIIGVIAAIAIPRVTQGTKGATETAFTSNLALLRNAIELYATEHNGTYPAGSAGGGGAIGSPQAFKAHLTLFTDIDGVTSPVRTEACKFGPYLAKDLPPVMVGPNKNSNTVMVGTSTDPLVPDGGADGWIYSYKTGEIIANTDATNAATKAYCDF